MLFRTIISAMGFKRNFGRQGSREKEGGADSGLREMERVF